MMSGLVDQRGFTYLGLMLFLVIAGIGLAGAGQVWHTELQREHEMELLFVGEQYAKAIGSYYENTPGSPKQYPASLQDLLKDNRFPIIKRHLRKLYRDPITNSEEWGLVRAKGRITAVYSLSRKSPLKKQGFPALWAAFAVAKDYGAWQFGYTSDNQALAQQLAQDSNGQSSYQDTSLLANVSSSDQSGKLASEGAKNDGIDLNIRPPQSDTDRSKMRECIAQRGLDSIACSKHCNVAGNGPVCGYCTTSIGLRYAACLNGGSSPSLFEGN